MKMHSMTFYALQSPCVRAIRFATDTYTPTRQVAFFNGEKIEVDDREPRNLLVEKLCLWIQENPS